MSALLNRLYARIRHRDAFQAGRTPGSARDLEALRGHKYCLLVTFRRSGEPVPTPVWFGLDDAGRAYVRSELDTGKVKRLRRDSHVRVAPCTVRGRPLGPGTEAAARILPAEEEGRAEAALAANYGLGRRVYEGVGSRFGMKTVYLEIVPGFPGAP
ncbi:MAG TPA: PPOX class F420-dependent oxidoreductase [Solirubrobacteraceae bacterium]|nr:PPOX class F420-dependent oxidoreductase [Solirubrobacteraceae bacterium]